MSTNTEKYFYTYFSPSYNDIFIHNSVGRRAVMVVSIPSVFFSHFLVFVVHSTVSREKTIVLRAIRLLVYNLEKKRKKN